MDQLLTKISDTAKANSYDINSLMAVNMEERANELIAKEENRRLKYEIHKQKYKEMAKQRRAEKKYQELLENGASDRRTDTQKRYIEEAKERIETLNAIEQENTSELMRRTNDLLEEKANTIEVDDALVEIGMPELDNTKPLSPEMPTQELHELSEKKHEIKLVKKEATQPQQRKSLSANDIMMLRSTSRPEITKLLTSLNINLDMQLTKADTQNLLACILTCNETQLTALEKNAKIPIAIKTIIKRIKEDAKVGDTDTIERLWDRLFGKSLAQDMPTTSQGSALLPDRPVSREAYLMIRDTFLK